MKANDVALHYLGGLKKALAKKNTHALRQSKMVDNSEPAPMDDTELGAEDLASLLHESAPGDAAEDAAEGETEMPGEPPDDVPGEEPPADPKLTKSKSKVLSTRRW
jgi:hypothetical protein